MEVTPMSQARWRWLREFDEAAPPRPVYTEAERRRIVATIARRHEAEGTAIDVLATAAGISGPTYYNWKKRLGPPGALALRPVEVVDAVVTAVPAASLVLLSPTGYRVEGLDLGGVAQLLRALS
jgi:hypothetical protein